MNSTNSLTNKSEEKAELRALMREHRKSIAAQAPDAAAHMTALFLANTLPDRNQIIGIYHALADELSVNLLAEQLASMNYQLALPAIISKDSALSFRKFHPQDALQPGIWGIMEPHADQPVVEPDILFIPLLAFDRSGNRLGYGGGYYDRTLKQLRSEKLIQAIGIGYAGQETEKVPTEAHDQKLDAILTDQEYLFITQPVPQSQHNL